MKEIWKDVITAMFMGMILPGILLNLGVLWLEGKQPEEAAVLATEETVQTVELTARVKLGESVVSMELDRYLTGVVLAEMPASFEAEALKAQAVAARTYTRKAWETGGKHGDGSVCAEPGCCQAYLTEERYLEIGGTREGLEKIRKAVLATSGCVLTYGEELIEATYFSCSGGSTEEAAAVWGVDYPYLQAVESPGEEKAVYDTDTVLMTAGEFQQRLGIRLEGSPAGWFGEVTWTAGDGVATMVIGGQVFSGTELRGKLGLRSTNFSVEASGDVLRITTRGYGHRVGMSQYGADAMAVTGADYRQILAHYYPGTELVRLEGE